MNSPNTSIKLEYDVIENDFSRAGEASSNIKKVLTKLGIDSQTIRRVAIVTYEAEMNIVIHSHGGKITAIISPEKIKITAKDKGPGIENIELAMQQGYSTAPNSVRELGFGAGMGLPNMKKWSDKFEIKSSHTDGTEVIMYIYLSNKHKK
ncbi:ATP-binding protein [Caldisalinibacter kiritimatiensis]|uniref:Anti-sigma B factor RsbT n=1 Tax=Caldisalinibacter kiritimatiensis TaxID=1304284 RepID=R1CT17_9FIRM|nr:anti-sigma regulatory factor [Caldisalinibacter kiritimatiensis]EOC99843.1 anti-sigma B factor RsbT [Caldisalinibacter kiritimatiensis]